MRENRTFTPNNYNLFLTPLQQLTLSRLKTLDSRLLKAVGKLLETSGNFMKIKENLYRDFRQERPSIVAIRPREISGNAKDSLIMKMKETYPTARFTLVILHSSDETTTLTYSGYQVEMIYGNSALTFLFGDNAGNIVLKMREEVKEYLQDMGREILSSESNLTT